MKEKKSKLTAYNKKRDFKKTPEPKPKIKKSNSGAIFVVQKHDASHLHYDFRNGNRWCPGFMGHSKRPFKRSDNQPFYLLI